MTQGEILKLARERAKLSQTELAMKVGYKDRSLIARIENGERSIPIRGSRVAAELGFEPRSTESEKVILYRYV